VLTRLSLQARVTAMLAVLVSIVVVAAFGFLVQRFVTSTEESLRARADIVASLQASAVSRAMWDMDETRIVGMLEALSEDPDFQAARILSPDGNAAQETGEFRDDDVVTAEKPILFDDGSGTTESLGTLVLQLSQGGVRKATTEAIGISIVAVLILLGVVIAAIYYNIRSITGPMKRIVDTLRQIREGEYDVSIDGLERRDELGDLARGVDTFRSGMKDADRIRTDRDLEKQRFEDSRKEALKEMAESLQTSVGQIAEQLSVASRSLETTSSVLTTASGKSRELSKNADDAARRAAGNVGTVASASEELSASISEINSQVSRSVIIAREAVEEAQSTAGLIAELDTASKEIGDIVNLIDEIAEQTNLLALNATIEAARAGEAGKGFAVVANEVKSLATQTGKATGEISDSIGHIQSRTESAVTAIERIRKVIADIDEISTTIAAAINQQEAAAQEIARSVGSASTSNEVISEAMAGLAGEVGKSDAAASDVHDASATVGALIGNLRQSIDGFLEKVRAQAR
jgi:methyl-accepting chemotaxis protein